jgi:hypothetical protein
MGPVAPVTVAVQELDEPPTSIAVGEQLTVVVVVAAACTASPIIDQFEPGLAPKLIVTARPDCVLLTISYSAAAGLLKTDQMVKPEVPAEPPPTSEPPPTIPKITSLGFVVETVTVDEEARGKQRAQEYSPVAGSTTSGSNGVTVFAPEIAYAIMA